MGRKTLIDGKEIELDDDTVKEIQSEGIKKYQEDNPDKTGEWEEKLKTSEDEKVDLQSQIEELKTEKDDKDDEDLDDTTKNLSALRKKGEEKDEKIKTLESKVKDTDDFVKSSALDKAVAKYAGGDEELEKKIRHNYEVTLSGVETTSEKELGAKVLQSAMLSGWTKTDSNALSGDAARTTGGTTPTDKTIDADTASVAGKLDITKEELEKHGKL